MKIVLVVASGIYAGKEIAIAGNQFVIGRDEDCNLRPASPAISKKHCAVYYKDGEPFVRDLGSTNGTFLNDQQVEGERALAEGDKVRVGPLDFTVKLVGAKSDNTPLPNALKSVGPASSTTSLRPVAGSASTDSGMKPISLAPSPSGTAAAAKPATAIPSAGSKPAATVKPAPVGDAGDDHIAAMLLGMSDEDGDPPHVPEGSTVMEMPAVDAYGNTILPKPEEKKKAAIEDSSSVARDLLSRMTRRPR
jgi:predicted component of type VI protein secretion system